MPVIPDDRVPRAIRNLRPGDHLCCLYETEEEHRAVLTPFLRQGLERGEKMLYIVDTYTAEAILGYLRDEGVDVEACLAGGRFVLLTREDAYLRDGVFDPERMIALLRAETERALAEGYPALRVTGEMTWALRGPPGSERLIEYEAKLNDFVSGSHCLALCQYDCRRFDAALLLDVLRTHPIAVIGAEAYDNFYYIPPGEFLSPYRPAVELQRWKESLARRRHAEEQLKAEQARSEAIIGAAPNLIVGLAERSRIVLFNRFAERLTGYTAEEVLGREWIELFVPPERQQELYDVWDDVVARQQVEHHYENPIVTKTGEQRLIRWNNTVLTQDGQFQMVLSIGEDITERKQAREALERAAQEWQITFDATNDAIWLMDADQRVLRFNRAAAELFQREGAGLYGRYCYEVVHGTGQPIPACPFLRACLSLRRETMDMQIGERWFQIAVDPIVDAAGQVTGAVHMVSDITARVRAEEYIRYQASLLENVSDAIVGTDMQFVIHSWNRGAEQLYGWTAEEAIGRVMGQLVPTHYPNDNRQEVLARFLAEGHWAGEAIQTRKDGTPRHVLAAVSLIRDRAGNPIGVVAVNRDITERKQAEEKIRESEETYRNLFHNAQVGLFRTRIADGKILESNEQLARMFGYDSREEFIAEYVTSRNYVDPGVRERMLEEIKRNGHVQNFEARFYRKDRSIFWARFSARIYEDKGWIEGVAEDITDRKQAEMQLWAAHAESQRLLAEAEQSRQVLLSVVEDQKRTEEALREANRRLTVLNQLGLALAQTFDLPTVYRTVHEHLAQLVDCPAFCISLYDEATGTLRAGYAFSDGETLDPACFPPLTIPPDSPRRGRAGAILTRQPTIVTDLPTAPAEGVVIVGLDDEAHRPRSALYVPLLAHGQTLGLLEVQSYRQDAYSEADIALLGPVAHQIGLSIENARLFAALQAERNSLAQRVAERTAELQAANRELEAFAYSVSHDLRAPLRALEGFSIALLSRYQGQLDEQGQHYLNRIRAATQRMDQLINDLLTLSHVSRYEMTRQTVDLSTLAREIAAELRAQDPHRQVEFTIADGMAAHGDAHLLRIALENLLGNAWKFTAPRSPAHIQVGMADRAGERVYFVRDNGVGFDMAYADKLFAPFQRLHSLHEFPGTGIGLATVQRIIARHGGRVWAEAKVDGGATFYFMLGR